LVGDAKVSELESADVVAVLTGEETLEREGKDGK